MRTTTINRVMFIIRSLSSTFSSGVSHFLQDSITKTLMVNILSCRVMIYERNALTKTLFYPSFLRFKPELWLVLRTVCHVRDDFSIYQSKIMTICLASLIIVTHSEHSQYSISKCSPLYSSLVIICTLYCTTINMRPN